MKRARARLVLSQEWVVAAADEKVVLNRSLADDSLDGLFADLAEATTARHLTVLLAPDLCEVRALDLPPLKPRDAEAIVQRDAKRFFLSQVEDAVVSVCASGHGRFLAGLVLGQKLEEIYQAAEVAGLHIDRITSVYEAWATANVIAAQHGGVWEVIYSNQRRIQDIRRIPAERSDLRQELLAGMEHNVISADSALREAALSNATVAMPFETHARRQAYLRRQRRENSLRYAAAMVLLVLSAAIHQVGQARELDHIRTERSRLSTALPAAAAQQETQIANESLARSIAELQGMRTSWAPLLSQIAALLPDDARLIEFNARMDTALVEVVSPNAVTTIEALKETRAMAAVRVIGSIRRREDTAGSRDEFTLAIPVQPRARQ